MLRICVHPKWLFWTWVASLALGSPAAYARKTNEPIYQDPFDLGSGGATLTRASKEGRVFANPALLPQGGGFHRWLGTTMSLLANKESVDTAREIFNAARGASKTSSSAAEGEEATDDASAQKDQAQQLVDKALKDPIRVGWGFALSWITSNVGLSVFSRFEPDIRAREYGSTGLPEVKFEVESYHGAALGAAFRTPLRFLSLGVTAKYIYAAEPTVNVQVSDSDAIRSFANPTFLQDLTSHNVGLGFDAGALIFLQGNWVDLSLAAKADDLGNTAMTGASDSPTQFKQVNSAGLGLTFHTGADAIHMAVDYRDIGGAYGEEMFKRVYAGTKYLIRTWVGLSAGFYNGYPSYGAEVDLIFLRLAATYFTRELGDHPGVDPRRIYLVSLSTGF